MLVTRREQLAYNILTWQICFIPLQFSGKKFLSLNVPWHRQKYCILQYFMSSSSLPPPQNQVHIWLSSVSKHTVENLFKLLSLEEKMKCKEFLSLESRDTFIVGRGVMRTALSKYLTICEPKDLSFTTLEGGKPVLQSSIPSTPRISFSLSHTKGLCAVAISCDREIGIDIENKNRKVKGYLDIAKKYLSDAELNWLLSQPSYQQMESFLRIWTLKESLVKATGEGIAKGSLKSFELDTEALDNVLHSCRKIVVGKYSRSTYNFLLLENIEPVFIAVSISYPHVEKISFLDIEGNCFLTESAFRP
ncbi:4'-phosphopantetheinyl transferase HetI [Galdieria sulphuraria]|nr:4'-phosphopantetheinyl transferase HetI [Galdieria sulphuraria]